MKLQNTVMQLRKVCSHPFLFDWPVDERTREPVINKDLVHASGKMMMLERLLDELFARGHKVLLFSQFTMMLDIIEVRAPFHSICPTLHRRQDWATEFKGWRLCRIDGSTSASDRAEQVALFQDPSKSKKDPPRMFLLSTRAGGMGLNLVEADTVIFYDQDWVSEASSKHPLSANTSVYYRIPRWISKPKIERTESGRRNPFSCSGWSRTIPSRRKSCSGRRKSDSWRRWSSPRVRFPATPS